ncbi:MAG: hypothetical protein IKF36_03560 [Bacilli bacterium]|nr:hypothetical protein [Bacilli bacterium]
MVKFKTCNCPNCGANIRFEEGQEKARCKHCDSDILIEKDYDYEIKKNFYERLKAGQKYNKGQKILSYIITVIVLGVFVFIGIKTYQSFNSDVSKSAFNIHFTYSNGRNNKFFVENYIDTVIDSNKKYKNHQIYVVYNDITTNKEHELKELKTNLEDKDYQISIDYDKDGYVNKMTIED